MPKFKYSSCKIFVRQHSNTRKYPDFSWRSVSLRLMLELIKHAQRILKKRTFHHVGARTRFLSLSPNPRHFRQKTIILFWFFLQQVFLDYCCLYQSGFALFILHFIFIFSHFFAVLATLICTTKYLQQKKQTPFFCCNKYFTVKLTGASMRGEHNNFTL